MRTATDSPATEARSAGRTGIQVPALPFLFLGVLVGMTGLVFLFVEVPLLLGLDSRWSARIEPYAWILHAHAACGVLAMFGGALQFFPFVRDARPRLHCAVGYVYMGATGVAGPLAVWIAIYHAEPPEALAAVAQAVLWLVTTAIAFLAIRSRDIATHQLWMARSYALTFTFVLHRYVIGILGVRLPGELGGTAAFVWLITLAAVLAADCIVTFYQPAKPFFRRSRAPA